MLFSDGKQRLFNSVITVLSLALGFNMAASFKTMAIDVRWWILSRKRRSLREVDLILNCDSMLNVLKLKLYCPPSIGHYFLRIMARTQPCRTNSCCHTWINVLYCFWNNTCINCNWQCDVSRYEVLLSKRRKVKAISTV